MLLGVYFSAFSAIPEAQAACPDTFSAVGGQLVQLLSCTETKNNGFNNTMDVAVPAGTNSGDLLITSVSVDGNQTFNAVAGWTLIGQTASSGSATLGVYSRVSDGAEPANYAFTWSGNGVSIATMKRFTGASGLVQTTTNTGTGTSPTAPSVNTVVDRSMILRLGGFDDADMAVDPATIMSGHTNIGQDDAGFVFFFFDFEISSSAAFRYRATPGASGTANFSLTASEEWNTRSIAIEPIQFRISHSGNASVCGIEQVTISVTDSAGNPLTWFDGQISLSATNSGSADWADGPGLTNSIVDNGSGNATYQFDPADNGVAVFEYHNPNTAAVNFGVEWNNGGSIFNESAGFDPVLTVDDQCEFRIEHDGAAGTCGIEPITITLVDSAGQQATRYTGTVDISLNTGSGGNFSVNTGSGTLSPDPDNDNNGAVSYTFAAADAGQVVLDYSNVTAGTINFNANDSGNGFPTDTDAPGLYDSNLIFGDCEVRITIADSANESDVCSVAQITFTVTDSGGATQDFVGTITISTDTSTGNWSGGGTNSVNNGTAGDGTATYVFDAADNGQVTLDFANAFVTPGGNPIDFSVTGTASNSASVSESGTVNDALTVVGCTVDIQVTDGSAEVCEAGELVTYTILDRDGSPATGYTGTLILNNDLGEGNYVASGASGTFANGASDDGIATYTFDDADDGELTVTFTDNAPSTVNLTASASGITLDAGSSRQVTTNACEFRISYIDATPGASDVCSAETVRITLVNSSGTTVTNYTGTINLSTTTGNGTWTDFDSDGTLTDPASGDGSASYTFVGSDNGAIDLTYVNINNETVNINVGDGVTTDPRDAMDPNDPSLTVDLCTFQFSFDGGGGGSPHNDAITNACSPQDVTLEVYDSNGSLATGFTGLVTLTTSTSNGNWSGGGSGTLIDVPGDDNGLATYQFVGADAGVVTFSYNNLNPETVNFNAVSGVIGVDGTADPDLEIQSCFPSVAAQACAAGAGPSTSVSLAIGAQASSAPLQGRMVVVATSAEGNADVSNVQFNGVNMTKIIEERIEAGNFDNNTEFWGILDSNLPTAANSYTAEAFHNDNDDLAMCAFYLTDVAQVFPSEAAGTAAGTQATNTQVASTMVTTTQNNALVISAVGNGSSGDYDNVSPNPPITRLFNGPDPDSGTFAGSSGVVAVASITTVDETATANPPNRHSHIVAAFNPLITGPPIPVGYEPVVLFQTYSGNLSYRAIGNSFRTAANPNACTFSSSASATLTLPDVPGGSFDSTVEAAYLYWFASGDDNLGQSDANVTFTDPSSTATNITADDIFLIESVGGGNNLDFFAGYKDVTALVTGNGSYSLSNLTIQNGSPWSDTQACGGGWALIVVYDNPFEQLRVLNLFHGFQPFQNSAFTLVPRNFRMATPDTTLDLPNGQVTHVTLEGDETLFNGDESLGIQDTPGGSTFTPLTTYHNPTQAEFNGTITRPIFQLVDVDPGPGVLQYYLFDPAAGQGGYEIDFPGPDVGPPAPGAGDAIGSSWGVDIDTHYISGDGDDTDGDNDLINAFGVAEAEEITTRYSSGQDLVMLVSEVISITNAPVADIEVFKTEVGSFPVSGTGTYEFEVTNNGNGASSFGSATGLITLTDTLPAGLTFASTGDVSGNGWNCSVQLDPGAFTCTFDIANDWTVARGANVAGELGETSLGSGVGESLPTLTANVQIGGTSFFPDLGNDVENVARVVHSGLGGCTAFPIGVSPNPSDCAKSPEFDNVNDLQGGAVDINDLDNKAGNNNNVDGVTTEIRGVETDLSIDKFVNGVLEEGGGTGDGQYTIRVTNLGPDATTANFTVTDSDPAFITFESVVADADWNCSTITPTLSCEYIGASLASGASKDLLLNVTVTGVEGNNVSNTASVSTGPFNFDPVSSNDDDTDITAIISPPVSSNERFLLSVSTYLGLGGTTDLANLSGFEDRDLVLYDPVLDEAELFYDYSAQTGHSFTDINAVHLLPNGQIVLSTRGPGTSTLPAAGGGSLNFGAEDLVLYDPLSDTATLYFDGSAIFTDSGEDIDAVYVLDNDNVVISTVGDASIGGTFFDKSDLVEYDAMAGTASIFVDGSDSDVFGSPDSVQVDAFYVRVDPADATGTIDTYAYSTDDSSATIGAGGTPVSGTTFSRDDVAELDRTNDESQTLFLGNIPLGVFRNNSTGNPDPALRLDALHLIEDGYLGHFGISQAQSGSTCQAGQITISKHQGLTHALDTDYFGSVLITTSTNTGTWGLVSGSGTLIDSTPGDGEAVYTFVPGDNGNVTLSLSINSVTTDLGVNVTNGIVSELSSEDPDFDFNNLVTVVSYRDEFTTAAFDNNDGTTGWDGDWVEIDDADGVNGGNSGAGTGVGNVQISGSLSLTSNPGTDSTGRDPSLARSADFSLYNATETVFLDFEYSYSSLNAADSIVVEVSDDDGANWTAFPAYTGLSGNGGPISQSLNVSTLGGSINDFTGTISIRFRVNNGYTLASTFFIDNVELRTGTTDCGIGLIDHYQILHNTNGIQCLASTITIIGHDANHFPSNPPGGEVMTLNTSTGKGTWPSVVSGSGALSDLGAQGATTNTDGQGLYTWTGTEDTVALRFNYTDPSSDPELVNFNLSGTYSEDLVTPNHDEDLLISQAGLRFFNESQQVAGIPTQISGKPSNQYASNDLLILQALRTSDEDPSVCEPLFPDGQSVFVEFAAECDDPDSCSVTAPAQQFTVNGDSIALVDDNGVAGASSYTPVEVTFNSQTTSTGAPIVLNYSDAGQVELHARYDIPFNNDADFSITSEDFLVGSDTFVVRPFGFDIDFNLDRAGGGSLSRADDSDGPAFTPAGQDFNATLTARRWQAVDDGNQDGVPDADANLTDNAATPNFGEESTANEDDVQLTHVLVEPAVAIGSRDGTLTGGSFNDFSTGTDSGDLQFDEVGIITLNANLSDNDYLNGGQDVQGNVVNVGRFYPDNFNLTASVAAEVCSSGDPFTYMGQRFPVSFILEARNADDVITQNYIRGFVKIAGSDFDADSVFQGVDDVASAADVDYSDRVLSVDGSFNVIFDDFGDASPGTGAVTGTLIFSRENDGVGVDGAPDGPLTVRLGTNVEDSDGVAISLTPGSDIDLDDGVTEPGTALYREISSGENEFRYGRLIIDNAFGPETEPLEIPVRVEYWTGSDFITNIDDDCTILDYNTADPLIEFVPGSFANPTGAPEPLDAGDTVIEQGSSDFEITLDDGSTGDTNIEANPNDPDRPFITSAPANQDVGSALVEIDLSNSSLAEQLDFLGFDWRGGPGEVDIYDEVPEGDDYTDNPRAIIQFGSYRGHDRVINWQEIYIGPD
ncbi:MAG: hypothetical protein PsegKO_15200 [Pseudohongiellaceae bacterium]